MPFCLDRWALCGLPAAAALACVLGLGHAGPPAAAPSLVVAGNRFELHDAAGGALPQAALLGAELSVDDGQGGQALLRIEAAYTDASDPEIALYTLSQRDAAGRWAPLCEPGPDGRGSAFPVSGIWTVQGEHRPGDGRFGLACSHSAIGKCVRMGYKYWQARSDQAPLWALHQACTRMLRADYCGDGTSHTRDGTLVNVADAWGIQRAEPEPARFEASWDAEGAVCVERSRLGGPEAADRIAAHCPGRFLRAAPGQCQATPAGQEGRRPLLHNRS